MRPCPSSSGHDVDRGTDDDASVGYALDSSRDTSCVDAPWKNNNRSRLPLLFFEDKSPPSLLHQSHLPFAVLIVVVPVVTIVVGDLLQNLDLRVRQPTVRRPWIPASYSSEGLHPTIVPRQVGPRANPHDGSQSHCNVHLRGH